MKTYLEVPYADKDQAKAIGARFDMSRKKWYCPDGIDLMLFRKWLATDTSIIDAMAKTVAKRRRA